MTKYGVEYCKSCKKVFLPYDLENGKCWECQQDDLNIEKNRKAKWMDAQTLINILFAIAGAMGGWILNNLKSSIDALQKADLSLADKVQHIEVLVAGTYVKRDDLDRLMTAIFAKLDKIEMKIDKKADK